jgi:hypothetical protein
MPDPSKFLKRLGEFRGVKTRKPKNRPMGKATHSPKISANIHIGGAGAGTRGKTSIMAIGSRKRGVLRRARLVVADMTNALRREFFIGKDIEQRPFVTGTSFFGDSAPKRKTPRSRERERGAGRFGSVIELRKRVYSSSEGSSQSVSSQPSSSQSSS